MEFTLNVPTTFVRFSISINDDPNRKLDINVGFPEENTAIDYAISNADGFLSSIQGAISKEEFDTLKENIYSIFFNEEEEEDKPFN
ncbi:MULTISPECIES: hypothetical protein [Calothrix]|uniref:Uncharacterized protein n=2 Tax=Calothrix TaxID=1186 RepID=A0ABR8AJH4_9CYAN|nr:MULTISPECIES: hypothetical protein [Calothrix]MBD2200172.1 hypothetical protein [Calothrix parietina FACHB-288]MBD2229118.1 hypothetical protein [Calothrix anomala FACHB-343]